MDLKATLASLAPDREWKVNAASGFSKFDLGESEVRKCWSSESLTAFGVSKVHGQITCPPLDLIALLPFYSVLSHAFAILLRKGHPAAVSAER